MASIATQRVLSNPSSSLPKFRYLSAWFCPYAHRATLALEHHFGRVEYEWVEALGWYQQKDDASSSSTTGTTDTSSHAWYYHWKADELTRVNPSALVPTLIPMIQVQDQQPDNNNNNTNNSKLLVADESKAVFESLVVMDYIDAVAEATSQDRLVSEDPYQAARQRIWTERVNRECCSPY
jgi:glutathione S-transferase